MDSYKMAARWQVLITAILCGFSLFAGESLADKLTIITTTSPIPSNPSTVMLEKTQASLSNLCGAEECKRIIVFDGVDPKKAEIAKFYPEYKENVEKLVSTHQVFKNTELVFCNDHLHLTGAIKTAMEKVTMPFVFIHQHDFAIRRKVDTLGILRSMEENPRLKHIRLPKISNVETQFEHHIDDVIEGPCYVPLLRTFSWSDNDHFSSVAYYRTEIFPRVTRRWPMEWVIHAIEKASTLEDPRNHEQFGTYSYGERGDGRYIIHLDGKRWKK